MTDSPVPNGGSVTKPEPAPIKSTYGETMQFCCEAQMYQHTIGLPSAVLKFCSRCAGARIGPLMTSRILDPWDTE